VRLDGIVKYPCPWTSAAVDKTVAPYVSFIMGLSGAARGQGLGVVDATMADGVEMGLLCSGCNSP
jgi:hypothetical protein